MDRFQVAATGVSLGASGLLLALGVGLVCDARARDDAMQARMARNHRASLARVQDGAAERASEQSAFASLVRTPRHTAPALVASAPDTNNVDVVIQELDGQASERTYSAIDGSTPELAKIRDAVLTGDSDKIHEAVAQHNALGGEPVYLHDDPELARRGIAVRARWNRHTAGFGVTLEATASDTNEPCTVLVAPGAIVKSGGDGYQDTAPIQARFIHVGPKQPRAQADAEICCAQIHSEDPRALPARGLTTHKDPRVARVAAAAEREHASWGAAQVAIWAVANDVTEGEVASAPGNYMGYIDPARQVLEAAGVDTNKLPLYANASPRPRRGALDLDILGRLRRG